MRPTTEGETQARTYDLDHPGFREGNYVIQKNDRYKDKITKAQNKIKRPVIGRKKKIQ